MPEVKSLENLCLHFVGKNAGHYGVSAIGELAQPVLSQLASYLGAYQLNRLHSVFCTKKISVEMIWKRHLAFHLNKSCDRPATIFNSDNKPSDCPVTSSEHEQSSHRLFIERLFKKVLSDKNSESCFNHYQKMTLMLRCVHGRAFHCIDSTDLDAIVIRDELLQYAHHVQILTLSAISSMIKDLLEDKDLLTILAQEVHRLDVYSINERNLALVKTIVRFLVQQGHLSQLSIFNSRLDSSLLKGLLLIASGQEFAGDGENQPVECCGFSCDDRPSDASVVAAEEQREDQRENVHSVTEHANIIDYTESEDEWEDSVVDLQTNAASDDLYDAALLSYSVSTQNNRFDSGYLDHHDHSNKLDSVSYKTVYRTLPNGEGDLSNYLRTSQVESEMDKYLVPLIQARTSENGLPVRSCTTLALAYFTGDRHLRKTLLEVLNGWQTLRRLAFIEVSSHDNHFDVMSHDTMMATGQLMNHANPNEMAEMMRFDHFLDERLRSGALTHIAINGTNLFLNVFICILSAQWSKTSKHAAQEISLHLSKLPEIPKSCGYFEGNFHGTVHLEFSPSYVDAELSKLIVDWITYDEDLKCVHVSNFQRSVDVISALAALTSRDIEELNLSASTFDLDCGDQLVSSLKSECWSLRRLVLTSCGISEDTFSSVESFVEAICECSSLVELNLHGNHLEELGCQLLKAICLRMMTRQYKPKQYELLDLSNNCIKGSLLIKTMREICNDRVLFPIVELNVSGNVFEGLRDELVCSFADCVTVLIADDPSFANPAGLLADHVAQM